MQLCLMIEGQEGVTWPQWQTLGRACEDHGIPTLLRSDHYLNLDGAHPERGSLDAWGTLCALAASTSTLRLGTMVSPASFRHPSVLAKLAVTADHVSGGRIEVGLGTGWHEREHAAFGFPYADLRTRMDVLAEQLAIVHGAWTSSPERPFSFAGEHYVLDELAARPAPLQHPHPPLILGGTAGPRAAALAARWADEYNTVFPTIDEVRERRGRIERACADAGRDPLPFSVMTAVVSGESDAELRDRLGRLAEKTGADADELRASPPAGWIVGTVDVAVARLRELAAEGVSRVMCQQLLHDDLDAVALLGERLAPAVA
ncbi:MAG: TIGR03560 family F420-dependent LLM class oxidoreductase [Solirubrobacterales bacterium]|nr:TIGR03560 family F420-dependent LLM class oxidoreductase [Solirubrobacterales bacterium]